MNLKFLNQKLHLNISFNYFTIGNWWFTFFLSFFFSIKWVSIIHFILYFVRKKYFYNRFVLLFPKSYNFSNKFLYLLFSFIFFINFFWFFNYRLNFIFFFLKSFTSKKYSTLRKEIKILEHYKLLIYIFLVFLFRSWYSFRVWTETEW